MSIFNKKIQGLSLRDWTVLIGIVVAILAVLLGPTILLLSVNPNHCFSNCNAPNTAPNGGGGDGGGGGGGG